MAGTAQGDRAECDAGIGPRIPALAPGSASWPLSQAVAPALGVDLTPVDVGDAGEIEREVVAFAREPNGGLMSSCGPFNYASSQV